MRLIFLTLLTVIAILGMVLVMQKGQDHIAAADAAPEVPGVLAGQSNADAEARATVTGSTEQAPALRTIDAAAFVPPPTEGPLERLPPLKPAADKAKESEKDKEKAAPPVYQLLARPAVASPAVLETTRGRVTLKGLLPMDEAAICGDVGKSWPCGQMAMTELRRLLRFRSVTCDIADANWKGDVTATCHLGNQDVAAWLVENGWAKAASGSPYEALMKEAEAAKRGLFGPDARGL